MRNLPAVVWSIIFENFSLVDLVTLKDVMSIDIQSIADMQARKRIMHFLTTAKISLSLAFATNGTCYKFCYKHPRASQYWHEKDHRGKYLCTVSALSSEFPYDFKYSRIFLSNTNLQMTLRASDSRILDGWRLNPTPRPLRKYAEPRELVFTTICFYSTLSCPPLTECLQLNFSTFENNSIETFEDIVHSPFRKQRKINQNITFECAWWLYGIRPRPKELPKEWFTFLKSEILVRSIFLAEKANDPSIPECWGWKILFCEAILNVLTIPSNIKEGKEIPVEELG